jgi:NADH:ubiquinone oxidoreductase subunit 6 (subunit J)
MPHPVYVTNAPDPVWIVVIVGAVVCLYWLRALRLAREGVRLWVRQLALAVLVFCGAMMMFSVTQLQTPRQPVQEEVIAGFAALIFFISYGGRKRSRYTPRQYEGQSSKEI